MAVIKITETGRAACKADQAVITLTVKRVKDSVAAAVSATDERVKEIESALAACGLNKDDLKSTSFGVTEEYENQPQNGGYKREFVGYACREGLRFSLDYEPARLGNAVSALTEEGQEGFAVTFTAKDAARLRREALAAAFIEARESALALAAASGNALGGVIEISYGGGSEGTAFRAENIAALSLRAARVELHPEEAQETVCVTVTWELK